MSGKHGRFKQKAPAQVWDIPPDELTSALEHRAHVIAATRHHILGQWSSAKKQLGRGARKTLCLMCGQAAFVVPRGMPSSSGVDALSKVQPGMRGDALFKKCVVEAEVLP